MSGINLTAASHEWRARPEDQRFTSLADLKTNVLSRRRQSWTATPRTNDLRVRVLENNGLGVEVYDGTAGEDRILKPSNWAFGQLCQYASAPGSYIRQLPAELAAINIQYGLEQNALRPDSLLLARSNGDNYLRAMTSTSYGRIWDHEVVEAVERVNQDGRWVIPAASYTTSNPKRATTLYASDRDVFIFLVDPVNQIEVNGRTYFRGFYTWNSEVGAATYGLCTFLYSYVCDNRIIWDATDVRELRIRHTGGAPERFAYEGVQYLKRYAEESSVKLIEGIKRASNTEIPLNRGKGETVQEWLSNRGFTKSQAKASVDAANAEEGGARTVWDIVNGITAYARSIPHTNERIELETKAGKLMSVVTE